ncbi:MAG: Y-family DNA polymerase [bacterium]|nr:Y-family DNA polymerase [bacterium]
MPRVFALVDCNNFYASCERVFQPRLRDRPIVVLSNNDGCVIARSNEAKAMGIPMGAPFFRFRRLAQHRQVEVFSSNYALYGDMSARVMRILQEFTPSLEVYSIDEAFLDLSGHARRDLGAYAREIAVAVRRSTGIPVSVGIGPTKVLAKAANRIAKRNPETGGVLDLAALGPHVDAHLERIAVRDVWGIGKRWAEKLEQLGIGNAAALRDADPSLVRRRCSVVVERIVHELRGVSCLALEEAAPPRRQVLTSRSFGTRVERYEDMREAVATFAARTAEKLREDRARAQALTVFLQTSEHDHRTPQYSNAATVPLPRATQDTGELIRAAMDALDRIWKPDHRYLKAGVMLLDLVPEDADQAVLFGAPGEAKRGESQRLMHVLDDVNREQGTGTVRYAAEGLRKAWRMKQERRSPAFTTRWDQLPIAKG